MLWKNIEETRWQFSWKDHGRNFVVKCGGQFSVKSMKSLGRCRQWHTQNIFMGGVHSLAYGGHLYLVCVVCDVTIWRHIDFSKPTFLAKFVDIICMLFYDTHFPYVLCHRPEYNLSALQVRISEENIFNATTQQFITAKISGCTLKQGSKTHSSLRQK